MEGKDPFALRKQDKKLSKMKQMKSEMKNEEFRKGKKSSKTGNEKTEGLTQPRMNKKMTKIEKDRNRLKADKKGLDKTLETGKLNLYLLRLNFFQYLFQFSF